MHTNCQTKSINSISSSNDNDQIVFLYSHIYYGIYVTIMYHTPSTGCTCVAQYLVMSKKGMTNRHNLYNHPSYKGT